MQRDRLPDRSYLALRRTSLSGESCPDRTQVGVVAVRSSYGGGSASLPEVTGNSGYITGLSLTLGRSFGSHGRRRSYLSAGCPAPGGFPGATFPFAKASFDFAEKASIGSTLTRSCKARG
jgi:hypothetical protein